MLLKRDERQFPFLFNLIRLSRERGLLIFIACPTTYVEKYLVDRLKTEFSKKFPIEEIPIHAWDYAPLQFIGGSENFSPDTLYIIGDFPFEGFYKKPGAMEDQLDRLTASLNIGRELLASRDLKCVIICPPEVENRIALKAPDFYSFSNYNASFTDARPFHERVDFLLEALETASREEVKGEIYSELGKLYFEVSDFDEALDMLKKAEVVHKKYNNSKSLASARETIQWIYRNQNKPGDALSLPSR